MRQPDLNEDFNDGVPEAIVNIVEQIVNLRDERKAVAESLKDAEERLFFALENFPDLGPTFTVDIGGRRVTMEISEKQTIKCKVLGGGSDQND